MSTRPTVLEDDMADRLTEVKELLAQTSPEALLKAFASLTHRMHATVHVDGGDLRVQRNLLEEELLRRLHRPAFPQITDVALNVAAQRMYEASDGLIVGSMTSKPKIVNMLAAGLRSLGVPRDALPLAGDHLG